MKDFEFKEWPKIPRGGAEQITITEKIDGTNAAIVADADGVIGAQSRKRIIRPGDDNFGFATWVEEHREELATLGEGYHYGEWAGPGIQKNPHGFPSRQFLLFNVARWNEDNPNRPACCGVVPTLYVGAYTPDIITRVMDELREKYVLLNRADGGLCHPEGIVVWYHKTRRYEKYTFENPEGKWKA